MRGTMLWSGIALAVLGLCGIAPAEEPAALAEGRQAVTLRQEAIKQLVGFLGDEAVFKECRPEAGQAVLLLGELRASEAVPLLLQHASYTGDPAVDGGLRRLPKLAHYPCIVALVKIGNPALDGLVKLIAPSSGSEVRLFAPMALVDIEGLPAALARLDAAVAVETDPDRRKALARAWSFIHPATVNPDMLTVFATGITAGPLPTNGPEAIMQGAKAVTQCRDATQSLIGFLDTPATLTNSPETAAAAMELLGDLRAPAAVDVLASNLTFRKPGVEPLQPPQLGDYPGALALGQIGGLAVVDAVLAVVSGTDDPLWAWVGTEILREMDGWQVAALRLRWEADKEPDAKPKERLLSLAAKLEQAYGHTPPAAPPAATGE